MNRKLYLDIFIFALVQSLFIIETQCNVNYLELNRMFAKAHNLRMQKKAIEQQPDAHNHEIPLVFNGQSQVRTLSQSMFASPAQRQPQFQPSFVQPIPQFQPNRPNVPVQPSFPKNLQSPHANMMSSFNKATPNSMSIDNFATTGIDVSQKLMSEKFKNEVNPMKALTALKAPNKFCPFKNPIKCDPLFPYRTLDGSCNNLQNLWWGQSETPFKRWMDADYSDQFKLNEPRVSIDGSELPNARDIVCALNGDSYEIEPFISHMFMQWGQVVNHDITSLSISREDDPDKTICKTCTRSTKCLPIPINSNFTCNCISQMRHPCIEFTRSSASFGDTSCTLGKREQLNMQTSFLDGSAVYGTSQEHLEKLRDRSLGKGLFKVQSRGFNKDLLPPDMTPKPSDCLDFTDKTRCFRAGDDRVNQNPALMTMHTLFVREHNRIARILSQINPQWEDETVFQETRRIVVAFLQHITYNEYLPILLGPRTMDRFKLNPGKGSEQIDQYNPNVDPRIANEWSAAAGRFGHSMIRTEYSRVNATYHKSGSNSYFLRNSYFRANGLYDECQGGLESIVRGMLKDPIMKVDRWFTSEITQHLFETQDKFGRPFHFDLVSININRGRDHGVPGYVKFREFCGLQPIRSWSEMRQFIPDDVVNVFSQFYKFIEDVELFLAMVSEFKDEGSIVGPTLTCLLGMQFQDLKIGDRFWYETNVSPASFTPGQINEIRKMSLSKFLCRNMADTPLIQPHAMLSSQLPENSLVTCENLPDIDWNFWRT